MIDTKKINFNFSFNSIKSKITNFLKKYGKFFHYVGKLFSTAILVILLLVGTFLLYYFVMTKMAIKDPSKKPPINIYTIVSGSMEPTIKVYDVVIDKAVTNPEDIKVGDVITFISTSSISEGLLVTHRVQEIKIVNGKYEFVTKGDFNGTADSDTAKFENLVGKVIFKIPQLGRIQFFVASKLGWFLVVMLPAFGVIIYDVMKLLRLVNAKKVATKLDDNNNLNKSTGNLVVDNALKEISKNDYLNDVINVKDNNQNDDDNISKDDLVNRLNDLKNK